jgi:putative membrane protein
MCRLLVARVLIVPDLANEDADPSFRSSISTDSAGEGRGRCSASRNRSLPPPYESADQEFLEQALGVNQLELQLGRLAAERATTPDVKAMGQKMVEKHTELGQQLAELARQSGGSGKAELSSDQRAIVDRVASQSGSGFDSVFKMVVDAGHVKELAMYRDEVSRAASPKLRELAERRVTKLQETVAQAEAPKNKPKHDW